MEIILGKQDALRACTHATAIGMLGRTFSFSLQQKIMCLLPVARSEKSLGLRK